MEDPAEGPFDPAGDTPGPPAFARRPPAARPYGARPPNSGPRPYGARPHDPRPRPYGARPPDTRPPGPSGRGRPYGVRPDGPSGPPPRPWSAPGAGPGVANAYRPGPPAPRVDLVDLETDELVAGRRPVEEAFVAHREARRLLVVPQRRQALEKLVLHATSLRIPIVEVEGGTLTALAGFDGHQGIALVVAPRRFADVDEILARAIERDQPAFVLVLDSLEDPQNVGTLLRSAEAAAAHGVVYPTHRQAPLTPSAIKASAGAVEHLLLAPVDDLPGALADLHVRGLRIVGADADAPLRSARPTCAARSRSSSGARGRGRPAVRRRCDLLVRIPMRGVVGSLNASVAGSILLYEASTQRGIPEASAQPAFPEPIADLRARAPKPGPGYQPSRSTMPHLGATRWSSPEPTRSRGRLRPTPWSGLRRAGRVEAWTHQGRVAGGRGIDHQARQQGGG